MRTEMSKAEAITRIDRFLSYLEEIYTPQCDCEEALIRRDDITAFVIARDALKERLHGTWRIDGIDFEDGKVTALYMSNEFHGLDYERFVPDRPHGEWKPHDQHGLTKVWYERYKCSNCNEYGWLNWHFCPNCGADMREGAEK